MNPFWVKIRHSLYFQTSPMPNYIMDLRKDIGHKPLIMVGASVIVEDAQGNILLQQRSDNHCWGYAGGAMELGETLESVAKRELAEETGLIAEELELFGVFSGEEFHHVYPNQDEVYIVDVVYLCKNYTGQLKAQEGEVERLAFFSADGLPEKISPPVKPVLQKWLSKAGRMKL